jgi:nicotinate-nucleotide pyrophosphorylase (carboxylating)
LSPELIAAQVRVALEEDVGAGDLTAGLIPETDRLSVQLISRGTAVLSGRPWFDRCFLELEPDVSIDWLVQEGEQVVPDQLLCRIEGTARALLTAERTALNYLQTLSGTATLAHRYAQAVSGTAVRILDTRKTLPGLRLQQKYAVRCGGCHNHRLGLYDAILIKENHIAAAGSVSAALEAARRNAPGVDVEVEVESLEQLEEALGAGARRVLLDNFPLERLREAVARNDGRARLEASGNVDLDSVRAIAETGVDEISVGGLTKDLRAADFSLRFV